MIFKRYYIGLWIRVLLLALVIFVFAWTINETGRFYTRLFLIMIMSFQLWELVNYQNRINSLLSRFLVNLKEQNLSFRFLQKEQSFQNLATLLTEIQQIILQANIEKEKQYQYLQYVVSHLDIGIITFRDDGRIELFNHASQKILGIPKPSSVMDLDRASDSLGNFVFALNGGENSMFRLSQGNTINQLLFRCSEFRIGTISMKLVSFQDIRNELEQQELESWQKLIRVLTHEIMNSVTPVNTLVQSMMRRFQKNGKPLLPADMNEEMITDMTEGLEMIGERGQGLVRFVDKFHSLSRLPKPVFQYLEPGKLAFRILKFYQEDFAGKGIRTELIIEDEKLTIPADENLLFQTLINLVKNAMEALEKTKDPMIVIRTGKDAGMHPFIEISDNGCGIPKSDTEKVFIPFYTTREHGSGIGLSLAREIMRLNNGRIDIESEEGKGTSVRLVF